MFAKFIVFAKVFTKGLRKHENKHFRFNLSPPATLLHRKSSFQKRKGTILRGWKGLQMVLLETGKGFVYIQRSHKRVQASNKGWGFSSDFL
jgi:hypothetical protein